MIKLMTFMFPIAFKGYHYKIPLAVYASFSNTEQCF